MALDSTRRRGREGERRWRCARRRAQDEGLGAWEGARAGRPEGRQGGTRAAVSGREHGVGQARRRSRARWALSQSLLSRALRSCVVQGAGAEEAGMGRDAQARWCAVGEVEVMDWKARAGGSSHNDEGCCAAVLCPRLRRSGGLPPLPASDRRLTLRATSRRSLAASEPRPHTLRELRALRALRACASALDVAVPERLATATAPVRAVKRAARRLATTSYTRWSGGRKGARGLLSRPARCKEAVSGRA